MGIRGVQVGGRPSAISFRREATLILEIVEYKERKSLRPEREPAEAPASLAQSSAPQQRPLLSAQNAGV